MRQVAFAEASDRAMTRRRSLREAYIEPIPQVTVPTGRRGPWEIQRETVTAEDASWSQVVSLDGRHVPEGRYTILRHDDEGVVMSDTPDERFDHAKFVRHATGHVLITGLGLGVAVGAVVGKPDVSHVTVIEISADIIALVGGHYACDRLTIIEADALAHRPPRGERYGAVWHDIWPAISDENLGDMRVLKRRYARRTSWQGCWCENECLRMRERWRAFA